MAFLLIISFYFIYKNPVFGISFFIANLVLFYYIYANWNDLRKAKNDQETVVNNNEKFIIDYIFIYESFGIESSLQKCESYLYIIYILRKNDSHFCIVYI